MYSAVQPLDMKAGGAVKSHLGETGDEGLCFIAGF